MNFVKSIALLLLLIILAACVTTSNRKQEEQQLREEYWSKVSIAFDNLYIRRPSLSPNGRYLVFDFIEYEYKKDILRNLFDEGSKLALYDLKNQQIEILELPRPMQWHSASFDATGRKLAVIAACLPYNSGCPAKMMRTQVGVVDLEKQGLQLVTDGTVPVDFWSTGFSRSNIAEMTTYTSNSQITRGYPVFSEDGKKIYYVISHSRFSVRDLSPKVYPHATLMVTDVPETEAFTAGKEEVLLYPEFGPTVFRGGGGPLSLSGNRLLFNTYDVSRGLNYAEFNDQKTTAYFYDINSKKVVPALTFSEQNDGMMLSDFSNQVLTPMSSVDGSRLLLIRGRSHKFLSLREKGKFRDLLSAQQVGAFGFQSSAISADGRWAVVLPLIMTDFDNIDSFWLIDLATNKRTELPLRSQLRQALETHLADENRLHSWLSPQ